MRILVICYGFPGAVVGQPATNVLSSSPRLSIRGGHGVAPSLIPKTQLPFLCLWGFRPGVLPGVSLLSRRR